MGKSKTKTKTNQTTTNAPPAFTAPGLTETANMTMQALGQIPTQHYSGPMVATMTPEQLAGITGAWNATAANAGQLGTTLQDLLPRLTTSPMSFSMALPDTAYSLAPRQELDNVINASIHPVQQQLMEQILPGITNSALQSGAYSNSRAMGVLPQTAIRDATDSMQRIAAQLGYEDYQNYENRRLAAYQAQTAAAQQNYALENQRQGLISQDDLARLMAAPDFVNSILHTQASQGDLLRMAAELETAQRQGAIQNAVNMDQWATMAPFMGLDQASTILARLSGNYGTQHTQGTTTTTQQQPIGQQILQGALGAASLAMGMPGGLGALGSLAGGAGGAASSLFAAGGALPLTTSFAASPFLSYAMPQLPGM